MIRIHCRALRPARDGEHGGGSREFFATERLGTAASPSRRHASCGRRGVATVSADDATGRDSLGAEEERRTSLAGAADAAVRRERAAADQRWTSAERAVQGGASGAAEDDERAAGVEDGADDGSGLAVRRDHPGRLSGGQLEADRVESEGGIGIML